MPVGRPSLYTEELADELCERLACGETLSAICSTPPTHEDLISVMNPDVVQREMPCAATVYNWLETNEIFLEKYTRARARQATHYADEIITISDNCTDHQKARLQVDARKWHASKTAPKKYGDKLETTHQGEVTITSIERTIVQA